MHLCFLLFASRLNTYKHIGSKKHRDEERKGESRQAEDGGIELWARIVPPRFHEAINDG